jgi:gamma-glutamyl-gamma-aminobutyrate hydrolase PuuD
VVDYRPRIGIVSQPVSKDKKKFFNFDEYILEINYNFIKWGGSVPVAIPYDIKQESLDKLLPQLNGVLFTGGALELIDEDENYHEYYKTAK